MQVLLVAVGTHGDVLPFIAIGAELKRRGHTVLLAAPEPFAPMAARVELPFHTLCSQTEYDRLSAENDLWRPWKGAGLALTAAAELTERTYHWISSHWRPDSQSVVVASTLSLGARVAQDKLGLPLVTLHVMPLLVESRQAPPVLPGLQLPWFFPARLRHWIGRGADTYVIGPAVLPILNAFRATLDLPPVRRLRHWWNSPLRVLLTFPAWFAPPQPDWSADITQVGFPVADRLGDTDEIGAELTKFLTAGDAPLVFTYGSAMRHGHHFFTTAVKVCERLGRRGILLAPDNAEAPVELPASMIRLSYAPFSRLLPSCLALIHHGGIGTVAQGLAAGIPQLIVPLAFDHFDEAARVRRLGVGTTLTQRGFKPDRAARVLRRLLTSPEVSRACTTARKRMVRENGTRAACDEIEITMRS